MKSYHINVALIVFVFFGSGWSSAQAADRAPTIVQAPTATPSSVTGIYSATAILSVSASDDAGEKNLIYTWSVCSTPPGGLAVFSANSTNAAKKTTATFRKTGTYAIRVTVTDRSGLSEASNVNVSVILTK